jgi:hypothetical protein
MASSAPREWLPRAAAADSSMAAVNPCRIQRLVDLQLQIAHQWNDHDQGQCDLVVAPDESTGAPDAVVAAGHDREDAALDAVKAQGTDHDPDKDLDVAAGLQQHQRHQDHEIDLHDLGEHLGAALDIVRKRVGDADPPHEQEQPDRWRLREGVLSLFCRQHPDQRGDGDNRRHRKVAREAVSQGMRVHQADPRPEHDPEPGIAQGIEATDQNDAHDQQVTHAGSPIPGRIPASRHPAGQGRSGRMYSSQPPTTRLCT